MSPPVRDQWVRRLALAALALSVPCSAAPPQPASPLSLPAAMEFAGTQYPAVRAARERVAAGQSDVVDAQTAYLPRADLSWQEVRATRNNVSGVLLPQSVIPSITGSVNDSTWRSIWGSAAGAALSWEPFDFGLRRARVDAARSTLEQLSAAVDATRLDAEAAAADAFLTVLAAEQSVRAAQANVDRLHVFATTVQTLVSQELRPGADRSRADAEEAVARNQLIQAQANLAVSRATLAERLGTPDAELNLATGPLLELPPELPSAPADLRAHPALRAEAAAVDTLHAQERAFGRAYAPRVQLIADVYGRGAGAAANGSIEGGSHGVWPDTGNWASGVTVTFPVMDWFTLNAKQHATASRAAAEHATYEQTLTALRADAVRAAALAEGARRIAANTPLQLRAARDAEVQARARYQAALAGVVEVAEAQRLLAQAEADDAIARLGVWRALLVAARVGGDLAPFVQLAGDHTTDKP